MLWVDRGAASEPSHHVTVSDDAQPGVSMQSLDSAVDAARKLAARDRRVVVINESYPEGLDPRLADVIEAPGGWSLADILYDPPPLLWVYPSGLVHDAAHRNWVWDFGRSDYRIGFAAQAEYYARRVRRDVNDVRGVPSDLIHGTCVFEATGDDWRMVQARGFPT